MTNDISIIFEDEEILVIDKPAGLLVHATEHSREETLADWIIKHRPEIEKVGEPEEIKGRLIPRPGIVHRLDRDTSGVMVIAKTPDMFTRLKQTFKNGKIRKTYIAAVHGKIRRDRGFIDLPIGMALAGGKRAATVSTRGRKRSAQTAFRVIARGQEATVVEVFPQTGRTHQIRVHFKALGNPVVGDRVYAPSQEPILGFDRLALHAWKLGIPGEGGAVREFQAPLPPEFKSVIDKLSSA